MNTETHNWFPDGIPDSLLQLDTQAFLRELQGPTLARFPGSGNGKPKAVATLLHGDEQTGIAALLQILRKRRQWDGDVWVLIGNVQAALTNSGRGVRHLDEQPDFNRVWGLDGHSPLHRAAADILDRLRAAELSSIVDVHNNTGNSPFYTLVPRITPEALRLASRFTTTVIHWQLRRNTLMEALCVPREGAHEVTAIALECGRTGHPQSLPFALDGLRRWFAEPDPTAGPDVPVEILANMRPVRLAPGHTIAFSDDDTAADVTVAPDVDRWNFRSTPDGHTLARVCDPASLVDLPLTVTSPDNHDVTDDFLEMRDGRIVTRRSVVPIMLPRTADAVRKDVLCYFTDRVNNPFEPDGQREDSERRATTSELVTDVTDAGPIDSRAA